MMAVEHGTLFHEKQSFRQPWLWALMGGLLAWSAVGLARAVRSTDTSPGGPAGALAAQTGLGALLYSLKMVTDVDPDGIWIRAMPIRLERRIPFGEVTSCEARTYNPLLEYGGWGIRYGRSGKAYNVSGNRGVQLVLGSGERLLIGSQRANELAGVIKARMIEQE